MRAPLRATECPSFGPDGGIDWYLLHLEPPGSRAQALHPHHRVLQRPTVGAGLQDLIVCFVGDDGCEQWVTAQHQP